MSHKSYKTQAVLATVAALTGTGQTQEASVSRDRLPFYGGNVELAAKFPAGSNPDEVLAEVTRPDGTKQTVRLFQVERLNGQTQWSEALRLPENQGPRDLVHQVRLFTKDDAGAETTLAERSVVVTGRGAVRSGNGLKGEYYADDRLGRMTTFRTDATVWFDWAGTNNPAMANKGFSVVWEGRLTPEYSEEYTFSVESENGYTLYLDGKRVLEKTRGGRTNPEAKLMLQAGRAMSFRFEYYVVREPAGVKLCWASPSTPKSVVPARQFSSDLKAPSTHRLAVTRTELEGDVAARGQMVPMTFSAKGTYPVEDAWVEMTSPDGKTSYLAAVEPNDREDGFDFASYCDFPANPGWKPMAYRLRVGVRDAAGLVAYSAERTVSVPGMAPPPAPERPRPTTSRPSPRPTPRPTNGSRPTYGGPANDVVTGSLSGYLGGAANPGAPVMEGFASEMIEFGKRYMGTKYVWGGTDLENGIDCSGFVMRLFGKYGKRLPRTAAEQAKVGQPVEKLEDLRPGDRLYFWEYKRGKVGHTAIYIGDNKFIHSSSSRGGVNIDDLRKNYWRRILVGARR
ncbi:MAG: C40 family peptidase [Fimbriimonadaceae bacterium]|nr:C40 family peptidase [Fimbriimonadaceae bacterium]